jgi:hypothetical protein
MTVQTLLNIEDQITPVPILSDGFKAEFIKRKVDWGHSGFSEFIFFRTYSRKKPDGSNESFPECVIRTTEGIMNIRRHYILKSGNPLPDDFEKDAEDFAHFTLTMRILPPGRSLWACGTDFMYRVGAACLNNCAYVSTSKDLALPLSMMMDYLMLGVGVGFDTLYTGEVHHPDRNNSFVYVIPDSREGWVDSVAMLLESYTATGEYVDLQSERTRESLTDVTHCRGKFPTMDYSQLRPKNSPIVGFGGTASGADPLIALHGEIVSYFERFLQFREENGLEALNTHGPVDYNYERLVTDIANSIGCCVVAGNVRRCLPEDSMVYSKRGLVPIRDIIVGDLVLTVGGYQPVTNTFDQGKQSLVRINTEDGWFDCTRNHKVSVFDKGELTWVEAGKLKRGDRLVRSTDFISGDHTEMPVFPGKTNIEIPRMTADVAFAVGVVSMCGQFYDNRVIIHTAVATEVVFAVLRKFVGQVYQKKNKIIVKNTDIIRYITTYWNSFRIPTFIMRATTDIRHAYLAGVQSTSLSKNLLASCKYDDCLNYMRDLQNLATATGYRYSLNVHPKSVNGQHELWISLKTAPESKDVRVLSLSRLSEEKHTYDIEVAEKHSFYCEGYLVHNSALLSLGDPTSETFLNLKNYKLNPERAPIGWMSNNTCRFQENADFSRIPDIAERIRTNGEPGFSNFMNIRKYGRIGDHKRPTWSRETEPDLATGMNPCAEIPLEDGELCNLVEVIPSRCRGEDGKFSMEIYLRALYYATMCATVTSWFMTHREHSNKVIRRNRRIGVSLTGIADLYTEIQFTKIINVFRKGYAFVRECNHIFAAQANKPDSIRVTTVKPSGTLSLLAGVSPGSHYPTFRYARRNVRVSDSSKIASFLIDQGVPYEKDLYSKNTLVFGFGIDQGPTPEAAKVSMADQFMLVVTLQREYADNMVSCTIYFNPKTEAETLEYAIALHAPVCKSFSILPHTDEGVYPQSPYVRISRKEYRSLKKYSNIDWSKYVGGLDGEGEKFCTNDVCELIKPDIEQIHDDDSDYVQLTDSMDLEQEDDTIKTYDVVDPPTGSMLSYIIGKFVSN